MVARFAPPKDHRSLIQAIQAIPGCELDLVGDGPTQPEMEDYAATLGVRDRVHFHGYQADVSGILAQADMFALISRHEGFPLTTLEAMRTGLPAIVSDVGGAGEAVTDGVTGYLVPRGDVAAIRNRIRTLVDQPSLRQQMGESARLAFAQSFTFDRMYDATLTVYREAAFALADEGCDMEDEDESDRSRPSVQAGGFRPGVLKALPSIHAFQRVWRSPWD